MRKSAIFVMKSLKINIVKIKKNDKVRNHCHYTGLYKGPGHSMFNSKYGIPKEIQ